MTSALPGGFLIEGNIIAYNQKIVDRIADLVGAMAAVEQKKMFGGVCFTFGGHMAWGVKDNCLIVRVGPQVYDDTLKLAHARPFDVTGRAMKGFVFVDAPGFKTKAALKKWIDRGHHFVTTLPSKS